LQRSRRAYSESGNEQTTPRPAHLQEAACHLARGLDHGGTMMKERPILFSAPMVRAILAGTKTQTRRVVKFPKWAVPDAIIEDGIWPECICKDTSCPSPLPCPCGQPGDRLWVREKCQAYELPSGLDGVRYLADDSFTPIENSEDAAERWGELACYGMKKSGRAECRKVPSIHMPRWASRILLEITAVRVERLNEISEADALAEGIAPTGDGAFHVEDAMFRDSNPCECYAQLWESINGAGSWSANPFVWVVEFRRLP